MMMRAATRTKAKPTPVAMPITVQFGSFFGDGVLDVDVFVGFVAVVGVGPDWPVVAVAGEFALLELLDAEDGESDEESESLEEGDFEDEGEDEVVVESEVEDAVELLSLDDESFDEVSLDEDSFGDDADDVSLGFELSDDFVGDDCCCCS